MDSNTVSKALSKTIKHLLKNEGFTENSTRKFWRYKSDRIEVVTFRSMGNILFNLPAASFSVELGIYFLEMPLEFEYKIKNDKPLPDESSCHFRYSLAKGIEQDFEGYKRNDVWFVTDDTVLVQSIEDCMSCLVKDGFAFFNQFESKHDALEFLLNVEENFQGGYTGVFGNGSLNSPKRHFHTAYFALMTGKTKIAQASLEKLLETPNIYFHLQRRFKSDYQKIVETQD